MLYRFAATYADGAIRSVVAKGFADAIEKLRELSDDVLPVGVVRRSEPVPVESEIAYFLALIDERDVVIKRHDRGVEGQDRGSWKGGVMTRSVEVVLEKLVEEIERLIRATSERDQLRDKCRDLEHSLHDQKERVGRYVKHEQLAEMVAIMRAVQEAVRAWEKGGATLVTIDKLVIISNQISAFFRANENFGG